MNINKKYCIEMLQKENDKICLKLKYEQIKQIIGKAEKEKINNEDFFTLDNNIKFLIIKNDFVINNYNLTEVYPKETLFVCFEAYSTIFIVTPMDVANTSYKYFFAVTNNKDIFDNPNNIYKYFKKTVTNHCENQNFINQCFSKYYDINNKIFKREFVDDKYSFLMYANTKNENSIVLVKPAKQINKYFYGTSIYIKVLKQQLLSIIYIAKLEYFMNKLQNKNIKNIEELIKTKENFLEYIIDFPKPKKSSFEDFEINKTIRLAYEIDSQTNEVLKYFNEIFSVRQEKFAAKNNRRMFLITILASIFTVLTFISVITDTLTLKDRYDWPINVLSKEYIIEYLKQDKLIDIDINKTNLLNYKINQEVIRQLNNINKK